MWWQASAHHEVQLDLGAVKPAAERWHSRPTASEAWQRHILGPRLRHGQQPWRQIPILTSMRLQAPPAVTPGAALMLHARAPQPHLTPDMRKAEVKHSLFAEAEMNDADSMAAHLRRTSIRQCQASLL